jgi:hypothetical protein
MQISRCASDLGASHRAGPVKKAPLSEIMPLPPATSVEKWFWEPLGCGENLPKASFLKHTPLIDIHNTIN